MIWIILAAVLAALMWYVFVKPLHYWSDRGVKQSKPWVFFGDSWVTIFRRQSFSEFVQWVYNMHPTSRYSGFYQFYTPTLVLRDPELIKQITVKDFDHFTDHRSFVDPDADPLWGRNLFSLKGQKWREMRATLSGSFTGSKMKTMFNLMNEAADNFVQYFLDKNEDLIELEMKDTYTRYTNDVIATTAFGIKVDSLTQPENTFYMMGKKMTNFSGILTSLKFFGYFLIPSLYKKLKISILDKSASEFFRTIINETIHTREEQGIVRPDMINMLLEARKGIKQDDNDTAQDNQDTGFATAQESHDITKFRQLKNLTNDDITSQALIFFFAGFDTISTAMCFGSYELAVNKDIQDRLRDEIRTTYEENNGKITYEVLLKMKYMDMVVSEILRMWPPVPANDRSCVKPYTIWPNTSDESPLEIPTEGLIWILSHAIHRDPKYYEDPNKFDPERFSIENKHKIRPYTYLPFGLGPRNCIGSRFALLEIKILFFKLLLNFELGIGEKMVYPLKLARNGFIHTAEGGFWLSLKKLDSST
ncbi:cytochrome P450 9e2-like isoform X2 [Rhynchophorus ferrugineus]|uniref:cytochrome P450 9e2-like isoform X2 n=1 Tax=Rhynchophorus ferrugineus TaxID=354439 RepID=UPI003FCC86DD